MASAAGALLRKNLTKSNRWRYAMRGAFSVRGGISKMLYHLKYGMLQLQLPDGRYTTMCIRVGDRFGSYVPVEDWMLAIALLAQHDEERLILVGHCGGGDKFHTGSLGHCHVCKAFLAAKDKLETKLAKRRKH